MSYTPTVSEGMYPEDAGWTMNGTDQILLLSIPMFSTIMNQEINSFDYTWLYTEELDAYIFCFRLKNGIEYAVIFQKGHAGLLLQEAEAYKNFSIVITDQSFEQLTEESSYITLPSISLERQTIAGW